MCRPKGYGFLQGLNYYSFLTWLPYRMNRQKAIMNEKLRINAPGPTNVRTVALVAASALRIYL